MATKRKRAAKRPAQGRAKSQSRDRGEAGPSSQPVWQGDLRLSLASCPVALFNAISRTNDISFHLLNPETNNRIRMVPTDPDTGPVDRKDLVKGYEIEKNHYVIVEPEELDAVKLETTHTLDIERFVDESDIDRLFWDNPYYLVPSEDSGVEAFIVIREALKETGQIALGRVVMHTRERLMALEPRGRGILGYTLRMRDEVIDPARVFGSIPATRPNRRMVEIARKIIEQKEGPFEPDKFSDRYETALRELVRRKERGEKIVTAEPVAESNVIDLMEALKKSLKRKGRSLPPRAANANARRRKSR